jgi:hypothetical protein
VERKVIWSVDKVERKVIWECVLGGEESEFRVCCG